MSKSESFLYGAARVDVSLIVDAAANEGPEFLRVSLTHCPAIAQDKDVGWFELPNHSNPLLTVAHAVAIALEQHSSTFHTIDEAKTIPVEVLTTPKPGIYRAVHGHEYRAGADRQFKATAFHMGDTIRLDVDLYPSREEGNPSVPKRAFTFNTFCKPDHAIVLAEVAARTIQEFNKVVEDEVKFLKERVKKLEQDAITLRNAHADALRALRERDAARDAADASRMANAKPEPYTATVYAEMGDIKAGLVTFSLPEHIIGIDFASGPDQGVVCIMHLEGNHWEILRTQMFKEEVQVTFGSDVIVEEIDGQKEEES